MGLVRRFTLRQEAAAAGAALFAAAPTARAAGGLEALRPARRVALAEDVAACNGDLTACEHAARPDLQFYPGAMPLPAANALLQRQRIFTPPPAVPPPGAWPPAGWAPPPALVARDRRRAERAKAGLPEVDPCDELEQQPLTDLRPAPGAPWGVAGGAPLPPQWRALPEAGGGDGGGALPGSADHDVSIAYAYGQ